MNDITFSVVGNVVNDVELRFTKSGEPVASFRVASGTRRFDRASQRWVDGDTHYFTVSCWRNLAHNVLETLGKGMPVIVFGRLRSREVQRPCGEHTHTVRYFDIEASSVGPDLARGIASFTRVKREAVIESERRSVADAMAQTGLADEGAVGQMGLGQGGAVGEMELAEGGVVDTETGEILHEAGSTAVPASAA